MTHVFFCVSKNVSVSCAYTQGKREQFSGFNLTLYAINNVFRKFSAFHDETGRLNVNGMNIISNDGSNKLNRIRKARVSYKVHRTISASLNASTSTRAVSSNPNFVTRHYFFFNDTATTEIYTLSLHDALPICQHEVLERPDPLAMLDDLPVDAVRVAGEHQALGHRLLRGDADQAGGRPRGGGHPGPRLDRKSTRLNSSH